MYYTETRNDRDYGGAVIVLLLIGFYVLTFVWYANTVIPRSYPTPYTNFFWGLLHGWFLPFTFVVSLFNGTVRLYQSHDSGNWYDFGFYMGVVAAYGGTRTATRR